MRISPDKLVIEHWLRLYNRLTGGSYTVTAWPDSDSSKKNVDALCTDANHRTLALEHTLVEPFESEKEDAARFLKTLAVLEDDPVLRQQGYTCIASQQVGAIPNGIRWDDIPAILKSQLAASLPNLPEGRNTVPVNIGRSSLEITVHKMRTLPTEQGHFFTARHRSDNPSHDLIRGALMRKLPKLAASNADRRILLIEKDAVAGTTEDQYGLVRDEPDIMALRGKIDAIWGINTAGLVKERVIFTNPIDPQEDDNHSFCSLNVDTDEFWQVTR
jgi:hypothetical protein